MLLRFEVKSPICYLCKLTEETAVHFFSSCSLSQNIWSQGSSIFFEFFYYPQYLATECHSCPGGNYMFKVSHKNTRTRCEICST